MTGRDSGFNLAHGLLAGVGSSATFAPLGLPLGGWMSGAIYDLSLSYQAAFINGIVWNALNAGIVIFLLMRIRGARDAVAGPVWQPR